MDLQTQALLRLSELSGAEDWSRMGVARGRVVMDEQARLLSSRPGGRLSVDEPQIPVGDGARIRARIYRPRDAGAELPVVVFYHGGGAVLGSLDSHDGECRALALGARAIVAAVDFRLAPEHKFPTPPNDAGAAFRWIVDNARRLGGDPSRVAVAGDSAGANLATVVARDTRGEVRRPMFQLLFYPALDFTRSLPSHRYKKRFSPTESGMSWFIHLYTRGSFDWVDPRVSPVLADDHHDLPPAAIFTAGFDPLRDDGRVYAERLAAAGIPVEFRCYEGLVHGFLNMSAAITGASQALDDAAAILRRVFASRGPVSSNPR